MFKFIQQKQYDKICSSCMEAMVAGDLEKAEQLGQKMVRTALELFGNDHPEYGNALAHLGMVYLSGGAFVQADRYVNEGMNILRAAVGERHVGVGRILNLLVEMNLNRGRLNEAEKQGRRAHDILTATVEFRSPEMAFSFCNLGRVNLERGNFLEAEEQLEQALSIRTDLFGVGHTDVAQVLEQLTYLHLIRRNPNKAISLAEKTVRVYTDSVGPEHPAVVEALSNLGGVKLVAGKLQEADTHFRESVALSIKLDGDQPGPDTIEVYRKIGNTYLETNLYEEAEYYFSQAVNGVRTALGEEAAVYTIQDQYHLVDLAFRSGRRNEAEQRLAGLIRAGEGDVDGDGGDMAFIHALDGIVNHWYGRYGEVEPKLKLALSLLEKRREHGPEVLDTLTQQLADFYMEIGRYAEAEKLYDSILARMETQRGEHDYVLSNPLELLATVCLKQGRYDKALAYLERALELLERVFGSNHLFSAHLHARLAEAADKLKNRDRADSHIRHAIRVMKQDGVSVAHEVRAEICTCALTYCQRRRDYAKAVQYGRAALNYMKKAYPRFDDRVIPYQLRLARVLAFDGAVEEAGLLFDEAVGRRRKYHGEDHLTLAGALYEKGLFDLARNRREEGRNALLMAFTMQQKNLVPGHPHRISTATHLAIDYFRHRELEKAAHMFEGVLSDLEAGDRDRPTETVTALTNLSICRTRLGQPAAARELLGRALEIGEKRLGADHAKCQRLRADLHRLDTVLAKGESTVDAGGGREDSVPEIIQFL